MVSMKFQVKMVNTIKKEILSMVLEMVISMSEKEKNSVLLNLLMENKLMRMIDLRIFILIFYFFIFSIVKESFILIWHETKISNEK
jgi:hypothetical protein